MTDALTNLITTYNELNAAVVDELHEEPSALEFMRSVATNRPFVIRGAATDWQACKKWDADYLRQTMQEEQVKVAVTPSGNADAVVEQADGELIFVEPHEIFEPFSDFLDDVQASLPMQHVKYAQTQNGNLPTEYSPLSQDVPPDIFFARIALNQSAPDAVNFWLGNERSTTALHRDNYENIYVQIRGQKHFVLLPPVCMPCVNEQMLRRARYALVSSPSLQASAGDDSATLEQSETEPELKINLNLEDTDPVPVATWDPSLPDQRTTPYTSLAVPLHVTLNEGDMLYLPSTWYHKVSQTSGEEGFSCAVNYWYDMDFSGQQWTMNNFVRDVYWAEQKRPVYGRLKTEVEDEAGQ